MLAEAQKEEQVILRYGKPFAVVVSYEDYFSDANFESAAAMFKRISPKETLEPPPRTETMHDIEL